MEAVNCLVRWAGHSVGRILLLVGVAAGVYQVYRQWRLQRALRQVAGQVVLITGASSGLGEGGWGQHRGKSGISSNT